MGVKPITHRIKKAPTSPNRFWQAIIPMAMEKMKEGEEKKEEEEEDDKKDESKKSK